MTLAFLLALFSAGIFANLAGFHRKRAQFWKSAFDGQHESHMAFLREQQRWQAERRAALDEWQRRQYEGMQNAIPRGWN